MGSRENTALAVIVITGVSLYLVAFHDDLLWTAFGMLTGGGP